MQQHGVGTVCRNHPDAIAAALAQLRDAARSGRLRSREPVAGVGFDARAAAYEHMLLGLRQPIQA